MGIKIQNSEGTKTNAASSQAGQSRASSNAASAVGGPNASFMETVEELELQALFKDLDFVGGKLSRFPNLTLLNQYRSLVKQLLGRARGNMSVKREYKWRRTERAMFVTIERAENALDELDEILMHEGERTRLLSLMEEIKGCLISLLL